MKKVLSSVIPAFLLAVSVGQIYAFTNFSDGIATAISTADSPITKAQVQFAFSLGIFFLGMGAAFFGKIVERNIRLSTVVGTVLFLSGLCVTEFGVIAKSLCLIYLGYGLLLGLGTGIIYISPVKTMMLWFPKRKALAAALPIISFGLGSTLSTILYKWIEPMGITRSFLVYVAIYLPPMALGCLMLKKPCKEALCDARSGTDGQVVVPETEAKFAYSGLLKDGFFWRSWLFMFLNISCGLMLIPLARQMMGTASVGYSVGLIGWIVALSGIMNGGGRFLFAWVSDRLKVRLDVLLVILGISAGVMGLSLIPAMIGLALLVVNACYGAGFSVIPAILADHFGMGNISKIHGAVLSAWGFAGLVGNQMAILVSDKMGLGYYGVVVMLMALYGANYWNACRLKMTA